MPNRKSVTNSTKEKKEKKCLAGKEISPVTGRCVKECVSPKKRNEKGRCVNEKEKKVKGAKDAKDAKEKEKKPKKVKEENPKKEKDVKPKKEKDVKPKKEKDVKPKKEKDVKPKKECRPDQIRRENGRCVLAPKKREIMIKGLDGGYHQFTINRTKTRPEPTVKKDLIDPLAQRLNVHPSTIRLVYFLYPNEENDNEIVNLQPEQKINDIPHDGVDEFAYMIDIPECPPGQKWNHRTGECEDQTMDEYEYSGDGDSKNKNIISFHRDLKTLWTEIHEQHKRFSVDVIHQLNLIINRFGQAVIKKAVSLSNDDNDDRDDRDDNDDRDDRDDNDDRDDRDDKKITTKDIKLAVQFFLKSGELNKHSITEGTRAVNNYMETLVWQKGPKPLRGGRTKGFVLSENAILDLIRVHSNVDDWSTLPIVYFAGVLEYLMSEICELSGNVTRDRKGMPQTEHVAIAIAYDDELNALFKRLNIII